MSVTARSTPNIALIKYWGNRNDAWRLPVADSLSVTLSAPFVDVSAEAADEFSLRSFEPDGTERPLAGRHRERFTTHLALTKAYLEELGAGGALPASASLTVRSHIPPSIGLASSAAVFSAVATAYAAMAAERIELTKEQVSVIARLGSGSAARSIFGGYAALLAGEGGGMGSSYAVQIADEGHWLLHDVVVIPSHEEKKVGSTEGHALAATSPHFAARIEAIGTRRQRECADAILHKDFEKLQAVAEEDSLDMHHVMETSTPPLQYLSGETRRIIREVSALRKAKHLPVLYTMDAGPTVHLFCLNEALPQVRQYAKEQEGCTVFESAVGCGSHIA